MVTFLGTLGSVMVVLICIVLLLVALISEQYKKDPSHDPQFVVKMDGWFSFLTIYEFLLIFVYLMVRLVPFEMDGVRLNHNIAMEISLVASTVGMAMGYLTRIFIKRVSDRLPRC